jgi:hypothetical protein
VRPGYIEIIEQKISGRGWSSSDVSSAALPGLGQALAAAGGHLVLDLRHHRIRLLLATVDEKPTGTLRNVATGLLE